jgi:hypothetical protein
MKYCDNILKAIGNTEETSASLSFFGQMATKLFHRQGFLGI